MLENTRRTCSAIGAAAGSTLCVGFAVVMGITPQSDATTTSVRAAAAVPLEAVPAIAELTPTTVAEAEVVPITTEAPATTVVATTTEPKVTTTVPPVSPERAPVPAEESEPAPAPVDPPAVDEAPASSAVPRRVPSSAEVDEALDGLRPYVQSVFSPGPAQVAEAGEKVCTAFDEGKSVEEVKAEGLALVKKVPFTTVKPGADDYVMRTTVALYCPGHASKLA